MIHLARFAAALFLASPFVTFTATAQGVVIERAPETPREDPAALRAENERLTRELDSTRHAVERLTADLANASATKTATDDALAKAQADLATLRALVARLESSRPGAAEKKRAEDAIEAAARLQEEKAALEAQLADARRGDTSFNEQLAGARAASAALSAELSSAETELAEVKRALAAAESETDRLKASATDAARAAVELNSLRDQKKSLEAQLAQARQSEAALREQLAAAPAPATTPDLAPRVAELENKLATALDSYTRAQTEIDQLRQGSSATASLAAELETLRAEKTQLEARLANQPPDNSQKLAELEDKLSTVLRSYSLIQAENEQLRKNTTDAEQLATELQTLRAEKADLETRLANQPPDLSAQLAETQDRLATTLRSYSLLEQQHDQIKAESDRAAESARAAAAKSANESAAQISALFDELRHTKAQVSVLSAENSQLKTRAALSGPPPGTVLSSPSRPGSPIAAAPVAVPTLPVAAEPAPAAPAPRQHRIGPGDTLTKISLQYYGTANRWEEIVRANPDIIRDENSIPLGATLTIP